MALGLLRLTGTSMCLVNRQVQTDKNKSSACNATITMDNIVTKKNKEALYALVLLFSRGFGSI